METNIFIHFECTFQLKDEHNYIDWIKKAVRKEERTIKELNFIFCTDADLHEKNLRFLRHDTFTDIITFDYSEDDTLHGDIFISVDRVKENASTFAVALDQEMKRVMIHGVLHLLGYNDKSSEEKEIMTNKENFYINQFTN